MYYFGLKEKVKNLFSKGVNKMRGILKTVRENYGIGPKTLSAIIFGVVFFAVGPLPLFNKLVALAGIIAIALIYEVRLSE